MLKCSFEERKFIMLQKIILLTLYVFCFSCITPKIHNTLLEKTALTESKLMKVEEKVLVLNKSIQEFERKVKTLENKNTTLINDSIQNGNAYNALKHKYNELWTFGVTQERQKTHVINNIVL